MAEAIRTLLKFYLKIWFTKISYFKSYLLFQDTVAKTVYVPVKDDKNDPIVVNVEVINPTEPTTIPTTTTEADMSPGTGPLIDNIESALKGYDIFKGEILNHKADPGIRLQIFEHWNTSGTNSYH